MPGVKVMGWHPLNRLKRWLLEKPEARLAPRIKRPDLVVHFWNGAAPEGRELRDISLTGTYIYTKEVWYPGTTLRIVLQGNQTVLRGSGAAVIESSICVSASIIRQGSDGIGVEFVFHDDEERERVRRFLEAMPRQSFQTAPPEKARQRRGQALIEFALILPLVFLLAVNAVNFGGFIFAWITVAGAARDAADYMIVSSESAGAPTPATLAQVTALVTSDVASLLNRASVVVATCTNATSSSNGCTTLTDPEAPSYTLATVDVTYTYKPLIPLFSFSSLKISATLPPATIHRKAVMRMMQ
jgi:Flp pilus assembly protein TadG